MKRTLKCYFACKGNLKYFKDRYDKFKPECPENCIHIYGHRIFKYCEFSLKCDKNFYDELYDYKYLRWKEVARK